MADDFQLDDVLLQHAACLGQTSLNYVLLAPHAEVQWFMLVPRTDAVELCDLPADIHDQLFSEAHHLGRAIRTRFNCDKLNVASIGNVVRQLHLHVIGRYFSDPFWPNGMWGQPVGPTRSAAEIAEITRWLESTFGNDFAVS